MTRQAPGRVSCRIVELAARTLPAAHRERYRREFTAELYFLPPSQQVRHASQVLSQAWALRAALDRPAPGTLGETAVKNHPARPLTCRLNLWHSWQVSRADDGTRYSRCAKCGKDKPDRDMRNTIGA